MIKNFIIKNNIKQIISNKEKKKLKKIIEEFQYLINVKKDALHTISKNFKLNFKQPELKKFSKFKNIIVIGMGGSILGSKAIYTYLKKKINKNFIFIDNLDSIKLNLVKKNIKLKKSCFIIISKSGNTLETLVNSNLLNNKINSKNSIIITEKKKSLLKTYSLKKKIKLIEHKSYVGGRYSVLSEVGMVPAILMGLNINSFRKNLLTFLHAKKGLLMDSVIRLKSIYSSKKTNSLVFLNYAPELDDFLYWCQQLIAESLGKKGKGLIPIVSSVPRDHHSLMQLYLDGPRDKLFVIFSLSQQEKIKTNANIFDKMFNYAQSKDFSKIRAAQRKALLQELKNKKIPHREFEVNKLNEETLGELFSYFILETVLVGKLLKINPYDQPAVENVKILTKKYLI